VSSGIPTVYLHGNPHILAVGTHSSSQYYFLLQRHKFSSSLTMDAGNRRSFVVKLHKSFHTLPSFSFHPLQQTFEAVFMALRTIIFPSIINLLPYMRECYTCTK
jgi:hypothetical protein